VGRVHRLGQTHPVQVVHLLTEESIEERVWETLKLKRALFAGLFDLTTDEASFEKLGRKTTMQVIKEVFCDQPGRPKPIISPQPAAPIPITEAEKARKSTAESSADRGTSAQVAAPTGPEAPVPEVQKSAPGVSLDRTPAAADLGQAAAKLLEAGLSFLETIAPPAPGAIRSTDHARSIERAFSSLLRTDAQTQRPVLTVPLPESFTAERVAGALGGLLAKLAGLA
jgi:hypothetical protein